MYIPLPKYATKKPANIDKLLIICPEEDSNLHPVKDTALNRARLPVPPSGLNWVGKSIYKLQEKSIPVFSTLYFDTNKYYDLCLNLIPK